MKDAVSSYLDFLTVEQGRSANTVASYRRDLQRAADFFRSQGASEWSAVDQYAIMDLVTSLKKQGRSTATINRLLSVLRQFYRYLVRHQQLRFNPMELVDNEQPAADRQPVILTADELKQVVNGPVTGGALGQRDQAILALMAATGLRVSELIALQLDDLHLDVKMVRLGASSKRERLVPVSTVAVSRLQDYLTNGRPQLAAENESAVFVNAHGHQLTRQGVWKNLKARVKAAGIKKTVTLQDLRYSFVVYLLHSGADTRLVQGMLGYSEMRALKPYLKMTATELSADYERHQPWI